MKKHKLATTKTRKSNTVMLKKLLSTALMLILVISISSVGLPGTTVLAADPPDYTHVLLVCKDYYGNPIQGVKFTATAVVGSSEYPISVDGDSEFFSDDDGNVYIPWGGVYGTNVIVKLDKDWIDMNGDFYIFGMSPVSYPGGGYTNPHRIDYETVAGNNEWRIVLEYGRVNIYYGRTGQNTEFAPGFEIFEVPEYKKDPDLEAQLTLTKTVAEVDGVPVTGDGTPVVEEGQTVTFEFTVLNTGDTKGFFKKLIDTLPENFSVVLADNPGWSLNDGEYIYRYNDYVYPAARDNATGAEIPALPVVIRLIATLDSALPNNEGFVRNNALVKWEGQDEPADYADVHVVEPEEIVVIEFGAAEISIKKTISGTDSTDRVFTFNIEQAANVEGGVYEGEDAIATAPVSTDGIIGTDGVVVPVTIEGFEEAGVYYFNISEDLTDEGSGWTYSRESYIVTVYVDEDGAVTVGFPEGFSDEEPLVFSNAYEDETVTVGQPPYRPGGVTTPVLPVVEGPVVDQVVVEEAVEEAVEEIVVIEAPEVPLTELPDAEELEVVIEDEAPPLGELPQTGTSGFIVIYLLLAGLTLAGVGVVLFDTDLIKINLRRFNKKD